MAFDPYSEWLHIPADRRPPTWYDLLGLTPGESDPEAISRAVQERYDRVRNYASGPLGDQANRILDELAEARRTLTDRDKKFRYDASLLGAPETSLLVESATTAAVSGDSPSWTGTEPVHSGSSGDQTRSEGPAGAKLCPKCAATLRSQDVICVQCGWDLRHSRQIATHFGFRERKSVAGTAVQEDAGPVRLADHGRRAVGAGTALWKNLRAAPVTGTVILLSFLALFYLISAIGDVYARWQVRYAMDGIMSEILTAMQEDSQGRMAIGAEGIIRVKAPEFSQYLWYLPNYLEQFESGDSRLVRKQQHILQSLIAQLPANVDVTPLHRIPSHSFAYAVAQKVLTERAVPGQVGTQATPPPPTELAKEADLAREPADQKSAPSAGSR